jgi:hypothetical protein
LTPGIRKTIEGIILPNSALEAKNKKICFTFIDILPAHSIFFTRNTFRNSNSLSFEHFQEKKSGSRKGKAGCSLGSEQKIWFQYDNRSKIFGVENWALYGSNSP